MRIEKENKNLLPKWACKSLSMQPGLLVDYVTVLSLYAKFYSARLQYRRQPEDKATKAFLPDKDCSTANGRLTF